MAYPDFTPEWAKQSVIMSDGTPNKVRPDVALREYGFSPNSFPTPQELNWQLNNIYLYIQELRSQIVAPSQLPVGFIMMLTGTTDNPNALLGYGTWERIGQGRTIIGAGTGVDEKGVSRTFTDGQTTGEYDHTLSIDEIPQHSHTGGLTGPTGSTSARIEGYPSKPPANDNYVLGSTGSTGSSQAHNNVQPSLVCHIWKRTE